MTQSLTALMASIAEHNQALVTLSTPYDLQIQPLELDKALACAPHIREIRTLQADAKPLLVDAQTTLRYGPISAGYSERTRWDTEALLALTYPEIALCRHVTAIITWRGLAKSLTK